MERPWTSLLFPVEGLRPEVAWTVGRVVFHPSSDTDEYLRRLDPNRGGFVRPDQLRQAAAGGCLAEVTAGDTIDAAVEAVQAAVDALRLFAVGAAVVAPTWFGLNGGNRRSRLPYLALSDDGQAGMGGRARGAPPGFRLVAADYERWMGSPGYQFLSRALEDPDASESSRRAVIGTSLVARASDEYLPSIRMFYAIAAVDAWLGQRGPGAQTNRLAQAVAWLVCGTESDSLCGRDRPLCAFLTLLPQEGARLGAARLIGDDDPTRACPTWSDLQDWYDRRSEVAHGKSLAVSDKGRYAMEWGAWPRSRATR